MSRFVQVTSAYGSSPVWVNMDLVREMTREAAVDNDCQGRSPERTRLSFDRSGNRDNWDVTYALETPEAILGLAKDSAS